MDDARFVSPNFKGTRFFDEIDEFGSSIAARIKIGSENREPLADAAQMYPSVFVVELRNRFSN